MSAKEEKCSPPMTIQQPKTTEKEEIIDLTMDDKDNEPVLIGKSQQTNRTEELGISNGRHNVGVATVKHQQNTPGASGDITQRINTKNNGDSTATKMLLPPKTTQKSESQTAVLDTNSLNNLLRKAYRAGMDNSQTNKQRFHHPAVLCPHEFGTGHQHLIATKALACGHSGDLFGSKSHVIQSKSKHIKTPHFGCVFSSLCYALCLTVR